MDVYRCVCYIIVGIACLFESPRGADDTDDSDSWGIIMIHCLYLTRVFLAVFAFLLIGGGFQNETFALGLPLTGTYGERILSVGKLNDSDYSGDGRFVATCHSVGAFVWDAESGEALYWLDRNVNVDRIVFSPDSKYLYTGSLQTKVWDLQTLKAIRVYDAIGPISFSSDGGLLLIKDRLWNADTGDLIREFPHPDEIVDAALSPDGKLALILTSRFEFINYPQQTDTVRLWDVDDGEVIGSLTYVMDISSQAYTIDEIAFSPDGKYMMICSNDAVRGFAEVLSTETGESINYFWSTGRSFFLPDGKGILQHRLYSTALLDLNTGEEVRSIPISLSHDSIKISRDGKRILLDNELVDLETGDVIQRYAFSDVDMGGVKFISYIPSDESLLFWGWGAESAYLMSVANGKIIRQFQHDGPFVTAASPDLFGKYLVLWGDGFSVWDIESGQLVCFLPNEWSTFADEVAISSDMKYVMSSYHFLWDVENGTKIEMNSFPAGYYDVAFSPDSRYVLTSKESVDLWDLNAKMLVRTFLSSELVHEIAYSPDGKTILTGFGGNTIEWDVESGERIATISHEGWPGEIKYSKSGEIFGIQTLGTHLRIYAAENGEFIGEFSSEYSIASYDFSADGNQLVVGGVDGTIRVWDISGIYREASEILYFDCYE